MIGSAVAVRLEPSNRDFWLLVPLSFAGTLLVTGALLALNVRAATLVATAIHALLFVVCAVAVLFSLLLFVTIIFFGTALVLFPPFFLLAMNSFSVLKRYAAERNARRSQNADMAPQRP